MKTFKNRIVGGFTLVELLVALAVGIILLGGLVQIFIMTKNNLRLQQGLNYMQENLRFSVSEIGYSAKMAGFFHTISRPSTRLAAAGSPYDSVAGVGNVQEKNDITILAGTPAAPPCGIESWTIGIRGFNSTEVPAGCVPPQNIVPGTDVVAFTYLRPAFLAMPQIRTPSAAAGTPQDLIQPPTDNPTNAGLYVLVFDSDRPGNINATQGGFLGTGGSLAPYINQELFFNPALDQDNILTNGSGATERFIKRSAALMPLQFEFYYVRRCSVLDGAGNCTVASDNGFPQPTLVKRRLVEDTGRFIDEPVVSGIEQMQIEYLASGCGGYQGAVAISTFANCDITPAVDGVGEDPVVARWQRVIGVRIALVARSTEREGEPDNLTYDLSADTPAYDPVAVSGPAGPLPENARYRRRVMVTLAQPRNALRPLPTL